MTREADLPPPAAHVERVLEAAGDLSLAVGPVERAAALEAIVDRARLALVGSGQEPPRAPRDALRRLFVGRAAALDRVAAQVDRALGAAQPVLIEGEPGTGKTLLAATLHHAARRGTLARVAAPTPPEAVRRALRAGAGALLCDEVATLSQAVQEELLRLLRAPTRRAPQVLATTRHDLDAAAAAGWFLPELRDRLHVLRLRLPPLREHPAAAVELFRLLLRGRCAPDEPPSLTPDALEALRAHRWPGNVRELDAAARALRDWCPHGPLERAHVARFVAQLAPIATTVAAPVAAAPPAPTRRDAPPPPAAPTAAPTLAAQERATIAERLARHGWRQGETARSLGIDRKTLYRKIREYELEAREE